MPQPSFPDDRFLIEYATILVVVAIVVLFVLTIWSPQLESFFCQLRVTYGHFAGPCPPPLK